MVKPIHVSTDTLASLPQQLSEMVILNHLFESANLQIKVDTIIMDPITYDEFLSHPAIKKIPLGFSDYCKIIVSEDVSGYRFVLSTDSHGGYHPK